MTISQNFQEKFINLLYSNNNFIEAPLELTPNGNKVFGEWEFKGDNNQFVATCIYSYNNGKMNDLAKCTIDVVQGNIKSVNYQRVSENERQNGTGEANYN